MPTRIIDSWDSGNRIFLAALPETASAMAGDKCFGESPKKVGTKGNDVIWGTSGDDVIWAGPGDDVIYGFGGNDKICAGGGNDKVFGGSGSDLFVFKTGDDKDYKDDIDENLLPQGESDDGFHGGIHPIKSL